MSEQEELKERLMKEFEGIIDRMLANKPEARDITLRYAEKTAVATGEKLKAVIAQELLKEYGEQDKGVECPDCRKRLGMKDYRSRRVVTEAGEVEVSRPYYYCEECRKGIFPPG
jgi:uncharacterized protein with PIN domain